MLQFTGKIVHVGQVEEFGTKGFKKRIVVLADQYNEIAFELHKDQVNLIDELDLSETKTVSFYLRGRKVNDRWYNTLLIHQVNL